MSCRRHDSLEFQRCSDRRFPLGIRTRVPRIATTLHQMLVTVGPGRCRGLFQQSLIFRHGPVVLGYCAALRWCRGRVFGATLLVSATSVGSDLSVEANGPSPSLDVRNQRRLPTRAGSPWRFEYVRNVLRRSLLMSGALMPSIRLDTTGRS